MFNYRDPSNIVLAAGASTHITPPSYMGEVEDPNFKGVSVDQEKMDSGSAGDKDVSLTGAVKTIWSGLVDDLTGKK